MIDMQLLNDGLMIVAAVAGLAIAVAIAIGVVFWIADARAAESFFDAYAQQHEMVLAGRSSLPPATPLLRKGSDRYADRTLTGLLGERVGGVLALYT